MHFVLNDPMQYIYIYIYSAFIFTIFLIIFLNLVKTYCEITVKPIRKSPARTPFICIKLLVLICYESWVMQWIILTTHSSRISIRLGTAVKRGPCGNMLVNGHVWIIKHYSWTLKLAYFKELQAAECSYWNHYQFLVFP